MILFKNRRIYKYQFLANNMSESIFLKVVGHSPKLRVLDFLLTFQAFDYSLTDIAKNSEVSYTSLMSFWPEFVKAGLVIETRKVGKARMFKLNEKNPIVRQMLRLQWTIAKKANEIFEKELVVNT